MVVRKASVSKASLFDAFLPELMVLPGFVILTFVILRVLAFDLSFAGTPFSCVGENGGLPNIGQFNFEQAGHFCALASDPQQANV